MEWCFSSVSLQPVSEAGRAFPLRETPQRNCGDALTVEVRRCKNHMRVSEFRSQLDLQLADDDGDNEAEFARMDNARFCRNYLLVMNASYSFRKRLPSP
jgi:hypothetical protein